MATDQEVGGSSPPVRTKIGDVVESSDNPTESVHHRWMRYAFREAEKAFAKDEVPVGAVVVFENQIIGRGHNLIETLQDPTAHAEIIALTAAANTLASWRLNETSLYVTLEPCPMCAGAIVLSRVESLVFAASDPRWGAIGSQINIPLTKGFDSKLEIFSGVMAKRSTELLNAFFEKLRNKNK